MHLWPCNKALQHKYWCNSQDQILECLLPAEKSHFIQEVLHDVFFLTRSYLQLAPILIILSLCQTSRWEFLNLSSFEASIQTPRRAHFVSDLGTLTNLRFQYNRSILNRRSMATIFKRIVSQGRGDPDPTRAGNCKMQCGNVFVLIVCLFAERTIINFSFNSYNWTLPSAPNN